MNGFRALNAHGFSQINAGYEITPADSPKTKTPKPLPHNSFGRSGISRARTYDLHDVNVAL